MPKEKNYKENDPTTDSNVLGAKQKHVSIEDVDSTLPPRSDPKLAYGRPRPLTSGVDVNDKVHSLERENIQLKSKENMLEMEIKKMQTKLQRIDELMRTAKDRRIGDGEFASLQNELDDQFGNFKDENAMMKERIRKLKIIQAGLTNQVERGGIGQSQVVKKARGTSSKGFRKSSVSGAGSKRPTTAATQMTNNITQSQTNLSFSTSVAAGTYTPQQMQVVAELRQQMQRNEREILRLRAEKDKLNSLNTHGGQMVTTDDLIRKIREREAEVRDITMQFEQLNVEFIKKEKIFNESKTYMQEILKQIHEAKLQNQQISQKNMRLNIQVQQMRTLQDQVKDFENERRQLEQSIMTITSQPFINRGDQGAQSALQRVAQLEERLMEKDKQLALIRSEEAKKQAELKTLQPQVERLKGERDLLHQQNKEKREKFQANKGNFEELNVYQTLFKMDPQRYGQTIKDLNQKPESYPVWADIDFLERGDHDAPKQGENNLNVEIKSLRFEIMKLRHENKDFAAELEKAQNLLSLQRDIERDNTKYFEQEKERLMVMAKSTSAKVEEMARKADEKQRQIAEINKRMAGGVGAPLTASQVGALPTAKKDETIAALDHLEAQSEFSAVTNESEIRPDENVLDLVIQDAEYYYEAFKQVLDEKDLLLHQKSLVTFVTLDFYNHDTETSQLAEGYRPLYNTQFSFKNRVDDFYVQFIQKNTLKVDVYISKNNAAIHIGHFEVHLRELIARENVLQEAAWKTPIIQKNVRIMGVRGDQPIGSLKFKMRMRKPVSEAARYFREKNEIENMKAIEGGSYSRKKLITVQVVGCKDLTVKYGDAVNISPFFYYQFYDFDERYSSTAAGKNPIFEDTQNYEVLFDAKMLHYLQKECLEIILFDDNAPITGISRGAQATAEQADDMIGTAMVPLTDLIKGASIHERFPVKKGNSRAGGETVGTLEVKISIIDLDQGNAASQSIVKAAQQTSLMHYNKQWESELIMRISRRLARLPGDVEMLFGVFSRGQKTVTKEDFKYTCLKRLQLAKEVSERELDMFLRGNPRLLDREILTQEDFLMIFSASITQAKHDILNEEAMQMTTIRRYEETMRDSARPAPLGGFAQPYEKIDTLGESVSKSSLNFTESEILEMLAKMRSSSASQNMVLDKIKAVSQNVGTIAQEPFILILQKEGNVSQFDASKIANFFNQKGVINVLLFEEYYRKSLQIQALNSGSMSKFISLIKSPMTSESLLRHLISQDLNRDGLINLDGFKAALLAPEFGMRRDEVQEIYSYLQGADGFFRYRDWALEQNGMLRGLLEGSVRASSTLSNEVQVPTGRNTAQMMQNMDPSMNESRFSSNTVNTSHQQYNIPSTIITEDPKLRIIKNKLKQYMQDQDITLSTLFKLIDTNSDESLTQAEFKQKLKALKTPLDEGEMQMLFSHLDKAAKGSIDYQCFIQEFPEINISYMLKKIKGIILGSKIPLETVFNDFCTDKQTKRMSLSDFKRFVKKYIDKSVDHEITSLFRHFAGANTLAGLTEQLTLQDFVNSFGRDVSDLSSTVACSIEDIIKPLCTKIAKFKVNVSELFEKYDRNKNKRLSAEELANALQKDMKMNLAEDEVQAIKEYFKNRHNTLEIGELDFISLLQMKFQRLFDEGEAKRALAIIKQRIYVGMGRTAKMICKDFDVEGIERLTLRNFKHALHSLRVLTQYQIDNLTKYLDTDDDGFISVDRFDVELRNVYVPNTGLGSTQGGPSATTILHQSSFGAASTAGKKRSKW